MSGAFPYRILVAADDPNLRHSLTLELESGGYAVAGAARSIEALFFLQVIAPHIIIYDLDLPNPPGHDFLAIVRTRFPHCSVIALGTTKGEAGAVPEGVFADAMHDKNHSSAGELLKKMSDLLHNAEARAAEHEKKSVAAFAANQRARRAS